MWNNKILQILIRTPSQTNTIPFVTGKYTGGEINTDFRNHPWMKREEWDDPSHSTNPETAAKLEGGKKRLLFLCIFYSQAW